MISHRMTSLLPLDLPYPAWLPSSFGDTVLWAVLYKEDLSFKAFIIEMYEMSNERVARGERKSARATA